MSNAGSQRGDPWGYAKPAHVAYDPQYLNPDPRVAVIVPTEYTNAAGERVQSAQYNIQFVDDRGDTPAGGARRGQKPGRSSLAHGRLQPKIGRSPNAVRWDGTVPPGLVQSGRVGGSAGLVEAGSPRARQLLAGPTSASSGLADRRGSVADPTSFFDSGSGGRGPGNTSGSDADGEAPSVIHRDPERHKFRIVREPADEALRAHIIQSGQLLAVSQHRKHVEAVETIAKSLERGHPSEATNLLEMHLRHGGRGAASSAASDDSG
ncbi:hypothetical protein DIPPA_26508 [Diplonema papillatum]|nr:hypothetical protein DIPPA_26508 [Diplonema papillatum]